MAIVEKATPGKTATVFVTTSACSNIFQSETYQVPFWSNGRTSKWRVGQHMGKNQ